MNGNPLRGLYGGCLHADKEANAITEANERCLQVAVHSVLKGSYD